MGRSDPAASDAVPGRAELQLGISRGWFSRGYLPHRDHPGLLQMITYRLADSLPAEALSRLEEELREADPSTKDARRRARIEELLDAGHGCCVLRCPAAADCVVTAWRHFSGQRYDLIAWVVMPNHVHVLIRVYEGVSLPTIVQSWKSYTSRRLAGRMSCDAGHASWECRIPARPMAGKNTGRAGARRSQVWMRDYWDRFIRDEAHFVAAIEYIHQNPVKAGLVAQSADWTWSSAGAALSGNFEPPGSAELQLGT